MWQQTVASGYKPREKKRKKETNMRAVATTQGDIEGTKKK